MCTERGEGDCFYASLLTGILRGITPTDAARLAAAGACCVTALGATTAIRDYQQIARLAGLTACEPAG